MEESPNSTSSATNLYKPSSKRLLFDRRYGWVIDEWKDPSKEALEGGRGMFCILPLARALVQRTSQSINLSATLATKASQNPQWFSHQNLQAAFDDGIRNFLSFKNSACKFNNGKNSPPDASNFSIESQVESLNLGFYLKGWSLMPFKLNRHCKLLCSTKEKLLF